MFIWWMKVSNVFVDSLTNSLTNCTQLTNDLYIILSLKISASEHFSFKISTSEQLHREISPLQFFTYSALFYWNLFLCYTFLSFSSSRHPDGTLTPQLSNAAQSWIAKSMVPKPAAQSHTPPLSGVLQSVIACNNNKITRPHNHLNDHMQPPSDTWTFAPARQQNTDFRRYPASDLPHFYCKTQSFAPHLTFHTHLIYLPFSLTSLVIDISSLSATRKFLLNFFWS